MINKTVRLQEVFEAEDSLRVHDEDFELYNMLNDRTQFTSLKNSNATRWSSTFSMLESVLTNKDVISECLHTIKSYDLMFGSKKNSPMQQNFSKVRSTPPLARC